MLLVAAAATLGAGPLGAAAAQDMVPDAPVETREAPPPPVRMIDRVPPEAVTISDGVTRVPRPPAALRVRISGDGKELWSGELLVDPSQGAELNNTLQQADSNCAPGIERGYLRRQTRLGLSLRKTGSRDGEFFSVFANWTRQSSDCALPGTRTVGVETTVEIAPGTSRVIEGDGGLRIELTRQK